MSKKLNKIIILDMEATCWEGEPPQNQYKEIIEVGICIIDIHNLKQIIKESYLIKPSSSEISEFCTKITGITQQMINENGISFEEICKILRKNFESEDITWSSWGDADRRQFERECQIKKVKYPFGPTHLNIKNLFAMKNKLDYEVPMDEALKILNIPLEGSHHRAADDAHNIGKIFIEMFKN